MGGYGAYVWTAYGLSLAVLALNAWVAIRREQHILTELSARHRIGTGT